MTDFYEDNQIISLLEQRNEEAVGALETTYGCLLKKLAFNITGDSRDAEECVSEVLLRMWNLIPPLKPANLSAFVCKILRNIAMNRMDYNMAAKRNAHMALSLEELYETLGCLPSAKGDEREGEALRYLINDFLENLRRDERIVFVKRYWYGDSIEEIAVVMGFSPSKVKSMLFRVRKKLRSQLEKEGIDI